MTVEEFLKNLGIDNQPIDNKGSGSDWNLVDIIERFSQVSEDSNTFEDVSRIVMKYMSNNHHPHTTLIARNDSCEVLEGIKALATNEYVKD